MATNLPKMPQNFGKISENYQMTIFFVNLRNVKNGFKIDKIYQIHTSLVRQSVKYASKSFIDFVPEEFLES